MTKKDDSDTLDLREEGIVITAETIAQPSGRAEAEAIFQTAKKRLIDVNRWHQIAGEALGHFQLTDEHGNGVENPVREGCHFRIDIPGPGTEQGDGFDWVRVEKVIELHQGSTEGIAIEVRPSSNPRRESNVTAHFYSPESTSTFYVAIKGDKVIALIYDRNLKPNGDSQGTFDQIRNAVIGALGILGFSKLQWKRLTDGLLDTNK